MGAIFSNSALSLAGPPKSALESRPLPGGSGSGVLSWRGGFGDAADEDGPVLVPVVDFFAVTGALLVGKQATSVSTSMSELTLLELLGMEGIGSSVEVDIGAGCTWRLTGDDRYGLDGETAIGVWAGFDSWEKGRACSTGALGGSIKLAIEGDALARFADLGGVDACGGPKGLWETLGGSIVEERTGSKFCPLDRGICWPGPRKARCGVGLCIAS